MNFVKRFGKDTKVLWKGKKHIWGLPISFTNYAIVEVPGRWRKLFEIKGLLHTTIEEVHLFRIDDFSVNRSLVNKMLGVGSIEVYFRDASHDTLRITRIKDVFKAYKLLTKYVEIDKEARGISYAELQRK